MTFRRNGGGAVKCGLCRISISLSTEIGVDEMKPSAGVMRRTGIMKVWILCLPVRYKIRGTEQYIRGGNYGFQRQMGMGNPIFLD